MARKRKSPDQLRGKMNLTIHPEVREWAQILMRRRSMSQLFEDLVEAEWNRQPAAAQNPLPPAPVPQPQTAPYFHQPSPYYYAPPTAAQPQ
jgi:hypothetical protein